MIFDCDGRERSDALPWHLKQLRQLLFIFYKLELDYDEETVQRTCSQAKEADADLRPYKAVEDLNGKPKFWPLTSGTEALIAKHARTLCHRVFASLDLVDILPRHGPGSESKGEKSWQTSNFRRIFQKLEQKYPFTEYFCFNLSHVSDTWHQFESLESKVSGTTKVVLVPKDSRGPRLISCEPLENQWIQQGQMRKMVSHLEHHPLTRGHVNFTDQGINRQLALQGSRYGNLATLDMKEASDRVSYELVKYLFPRNVFELIDSSRSTHMMFPDGTTLKMNKFAPMGSANCFPVEAIVFWALCVSVVHCTRNVPISESRDSIYVYGDDIICSSEDHAAIREYLPLFGLKVNDDKCCTGKTFKESCGCDAYKGIDVTPTKFSTVWCSPSSTRKNEERSLPRKRKGMPSIDAGTLASYVAYSNAMWEAGYCGLAEYLERQIQSICKVPYFTEASHDGIGFVRAHINPVTTNRALGLRLRFNRKLHRLEVRGWGIRTSHKETSECGWAELVRVQSYKDLPSLTSDEEVPIWHINSQGQIVINDPPHPVVARRYALRRRNSLNRRWIPVI